jgi:HEAT repeat protein
LAHRPEFDGNQCLLFSSKLLRSFKKSTVPLIMAWLDTLLLKSPNPRNLLKAWTDTLLVRLATLLLKSSDPRIRCKGVENLSGSSNPSDTELIFASLQDENPQVRSAAVRALAKTNKPATQQALVGALRDTNFQVREAAARALGGLGAPGSAEALARCLRDPDAAVRIAAASALRTIGWKPATKEELAWFEIALGNTPATVAADEGPQEPEPGQDTAFYRCLAAEALREKNDPVRINALLVALRGNDLLTRVSAVHDLGQIDDPWITQELLKLFRDRNDEVRLVAAQVLAARDDSPPAHFVGLLQDKSYEVRLVAVQFLGRIRHHQIVEVLAPLLSDENAWVRQATATALGLIGEASAIEALVTCLADEDEHMRFAVEQALEQIDPGWMHSEGAQKARGAC